MLRTSLWPGLARRCSKTRIVSKLRVRLFESGCALCPSPMRKLLTGAGAVGIACAGRLPEGWANGQ